jgi:NAD-specific glutamate dehydrogenase
MTFLVDSVAMALTRRGSAIHVFVHPMIKVHRDDEGRLLELLPWDAEGLVESLIHVAIDRRAEEVSLDQLRGYSNGRFYWAKTNPDSALRGQPWPTKHARPGARFDAPGLPART